MYKRMNEEVKEHIDSKKLRGGYYTPKPIADFICNWAIDNKDLKIIEPSCGDGNFIEAAINRLVNVNATISDINKNLKGIELIDVEANKTKVRVNKYGVDSDVIINSDFFSFLDKTGKKDTFDVVIGNPPFIRYQNFPTEHRDLAIKMMNDLGLKPNKLTNIWVPFLVIASSKLNVGGKLGMVIPAELFQVKYAAETRIFLSKFFSRITIITFKKLVFDNIQQEVVLLLCEKDVDVNTGIRVVEVQDLDELLQLNPIELHKTPVKSLEHSSEKWTKYFLDEDEIQILRKIKNDNKILPSSEVMDVDVGIVTGRNEFFMMSEDSLNKWNLKDYSQKVVGKALHLKGIIYDNEDFDNNIKAGYPVNLFLPESKPFDDLSKNVQEYISYGEEQGFNEGYKCRIRKLWYITPSIWTPDAFALRQVGEFPKLIVNRTEASSTDTVHRVKMKNNNDANIIALSFLNSLTFAFTEIMGRSYGGGVLTFEPTEVEELPLPILNNNHNLDILHIDQLMRERKIDEVLDIVDNELLIKQYGYSFDEVLKLRSIWKKLSSRRTGRKKK